MHPADVCQDTAEGADVAGAHMCAADMALDARKAYVLEGTLPQVDGKSSPMGADKQRKQGLQ